MIVLASAEVRHAGEAIFEQFSMCHSAVQAAERLLGLPDTTFVGVVAFGVIFYEFLADWTASVVRIFIRWRDSRQRQSP